MRDLVQSWINQVENLTQIAYTAPKTAYSTFVDGFIQHKFMLEISKLLEPLGKISNDKFIQAIKN